MKPQLIVLGINGLVGSRLKELLMEDFDLIGMDRVGGVDITKPETLTSIREHKDASFVLHLAAKTDVDGCELDRDQGEEGDAWRINVFGSENVAEICRETGKKLIYISTDFVFDGPEKDYTENSIPHPINWYGQTKYAGEQVVLNSSQNIVLRIAYPYRAKCGGPKKDFVHTLYHRLQRNESLTVLTDHIFTPTFIDDIAKSIETLIAKNASGIYHGVGGASLSPFEAAQVLARQFGFDERLITGVKTAGYYQGRAPRPLELRLKNDKIASLGVTMRAFGQGLEEIKRQGIE